MNRKGNGRPAAAGIIILVLCLLTAQGMLLSPAGETERELRMKNVIMPEISENTEKIQTACSLPDPAEPEPETDVPGKTEMKPKILSRVMETVWDEEILETTIQGGLSIKNATSYEVNAAELLRKGPSLRLSANGPQILIIHTHGSEAYTQAGLDHYEENDDHRTADAGHSIIRIGDELTDLLQEAGLDVIHDREIYDYPSYTGSYTRSGEAVKKYLEKYPDISVVFDIHRDALGADGTVYKTMAEEEGVCASQIMLLTGSDDSGLSHPDWRENLAFALYLQNAVSSRHPSLMRPVSLVRERYNLHLTGGSLIIEVGSSGNTLQEALAAIRLFADAAAPALLALQDE